MQPHKVAFYRRDSSGGPASLIARSRCFTIIPLPNRAAAKSGVSPPSNIVKTVIMIEPCALSLDLPALVRSGGFLFFFGFVYLSQGLRSCFFCSVLRPFSKVGNSEIHRTRLDYYSFYGISLLLEYHCGQPMRVGLVSVSAFKFHPP